MADELDRFLALVVRELGCDDARVVDPCGTGEPTAGHVLSAILPDGRVVAARFREPPADAEATLRHLEMLVGTFDAVVGASPPAHRSRPPAAITLRDELSALCVRAAALDAVVIDANSPVVWGAAHPEGLAARRALSVVRSWEDLAALRRGRRLRRAEREGDAPLLAHSFAGIYVLVLPFAGSFDELRAERAVLEALPRIERLVLALPPLDPQPPFQGAAAAALKGRRKR